MQGLRHRERLRDKHHYVLLSLRLNANVTTDRPGNANMTIFKYFFFEFCIFFFCSSSLWPIQRLARGIGRQARPHRPLVRASLARRYQDGLVLARVQVGLAQPWRGRPSHCWVSPHLATARPANAITCRPCQDLVRSSLAVTGFHLAQRRRGRPHLGWARSAW